MLNFFLFGSMLEKNPHASVRGETNNIVDKSSGIEPKEKRNYTV